MRHWGGREMVEKTGSVTGELNAPYIPSQAENTAGNAVAVTIVGMVYAHPLQVGGR
jgi:hypothetical protein